MSRSRWSISNALRQARGAVGSTRKATIATGDETVRWLLERAEREAMQLVRTLARAKAMKLRQRGDEPSRARRAA